MLGWWLDRADVRRLRALLALRNVELHGLALAQRAIALSGDPGEVDEYILATLWGDKAEAFLVAEPLNGSAHGVSSFLCGCEPLSWSTAFRRLRDVDQVREGPRDHPRPAP